ncbi:MAG: GGDEF domain-containing protein [Oscillospiraceae bacterium]|nr:GGDEF domain-containing protein [Oscillospiraceae bacterium]
MLRYQKYAVLFSGAAMLMIILLLFAVKHNEWKQNTAFDIMDAWHYADGSPVSMSGNINYNEKNEGSVFYRFDSPHTDSRSLCFRSHNIFFDVLADGEITYSFHPVLGSIYGNRYGDIIHTVPIPAGTTEIRIDIVSLVDDRWDGFYEMALEDSSGYINALAKSNLPAFCICAATFLIGVILFTAGIFALRTNKDMAESICLGVIIILFTVWCHSQIRILHIISPNPLLIRVMDYAAMELIPVPVWVYAASFTKSQKSPVVHAGIALTLLNFIISFTLTILNIADYNDFLVFTHALIVLGIISISFLIFSAVKKKQIIIKNIRLIITAFLAVAVCAFLDIFRFYVLHSSYTPLMSRIGLFVFILMISVYEFRKLFDMHVSSRQAELMKKLAMEDPLTGIGSRAAFSALENSLREKKDGKCIFIHFDVNNLKKVNDNYGHAEGDRFITAAADIINSSFGSSGRCFRVGGDEFFAVLDGENQMNDYENGIKKFTEEQDKFNASGSSPVPLMIAFGMAEYDLSDGDPEKAEQIADSRMYEKKKQMKAEN